MEPEIVMLVSSANIFGTNIVLGCIKAVWGSFIYIKKSKGPRILPCGTPQNIKNINTNITLEMLINYTKKYVRSNTLNIL